jgi:hypothetical protein
MKKKPQLKLVDTPTKKEILSYRRFWTDGTVAGTSSVARSAKGRGCEEESKLKKALVYSAPLGLLAGGLYVEDALKGFSVAAIDGKTGHYLFEKASPEKGSQEALAHLFGKALRKRGIEFVTRPSDPGGAGRSAGTMPIDPVSVIEKRSLRLREPSR